MVESAIVIPLMTFMILGVLQLAMIQHARIMTEYAAFNAARAGIVWNADPWVMENAAIISLLPTTEGLVEEGDIGNPEQMVRRIVMRALLYQINRRLPEAVDMVRNGTDHIIQQLPGGLQGGASQMRDTLLNSAQNWADSTLQNAVKNALGGDNLRMVQVFIHSPKDSDLPIDKPEIDFDNLLAANPKEWRRSTRLSIKVRYLYMMRIPFANWIIHQAWRAHRAGVRLYGAVHNATTDSSDTSMFNRGGAPVDLTGQPTNLEKTLNKLAGEGVYLIPLRAHYTMRMQSNPYRVSLMQQGPPDD
ncbi:TadE family protein [Myxococcota bacterium]